MTIVRITTSILCWALLTLSVDAQTGYFRDTTITQGRDFSFHIFSRGAGDRVSLRINRLLQLSELYSLRNRGKQKSIFDQARANDGSIYGGKTSIATTVHSNNHRILSVGFIESSSGATTHYWNKYYNFNSGNGDRLELTDLFTPSGYKQFFEAIVKVRTLKYQREVKKKVEAQYQASYLETSSCFESDDLQDFYVRNGNIFVVGDSCLIKAQKFDGLDMTVKIPVSSFKKYLNAYGMSLFGFTGSDISKFRSTKLPQLFEGSVDSKYRFVMVLGPAYGEEYGGMYAYLKYGEGIALRGNLKEDEIKLTEYILSPVSVDGPLGRIRHTVERGTVSGQIVDQRFDGFWTDKEKMQRLAFLAQVR